MQPVNRLVGIVGEALADGGVGQREFVDREPAGEDGRGCPHAASSCGVAVGNAVEGVGVDERGRFVDFLAAGPFGVELGGGHRRCVDDDVFVKTRGGLWRRHERHPGVEGIPYRRRSCR